MSKTKKLLKQAEISRKKWCAWNAWALGQSNEWFREAFYIPGRYRKGADKDFADMSLAHFMEIYELDYDCASMVFESCKYDIANMLETLGDDGKRYRYMFTFSREKHPQ